MVVRTKTLKGRPHLGGRIIRKYPPAIFCKDQAGVGIIIGAVAKSQIVEMRPSQGARSIAGIADLLPLARRKSVRPAVRRVRPAPRPPAQPALEIKYLIPPRQITNSPLTLTP